MPRRRSTFNFHLYKSDEILTLTQNIFCDLMYYAIFRLTLCNPHVNIERVNGIFLKTTLEVKVITSFYFANLLALCFYMFTGIFLMTNIFDINIKNGCEDILL